MLRLVSGAWDKSLLEKSNLLPNYGLVLQTEDDNSVNAWEIIKIATHLDTRLFKEQIEEEKRDLNWEILNGVQEGWRSDGNESLEMAISETS